MPATAQTATLTVMSKKPLASVSSFFSISGHQPPVLANVESSPLQYEAGMTAVPVTSALTVSSAAATALAGATVSIGAGFTASEDSLGFASQNGISGSYNSGTGRLTLTGSSSLANYRAALRSVTYGDSNGSSPSTGARTIGFQVNDGSASNNVSNVVSRRVDVTPNSPPVAGNVSASTDANTAIDINVLASASDPDGEPVTLIAVDTTGSKGTVSINGDRSVHYDPSGQFNNLQLGQSATDTFAYKVSDGTLSTNATVTVTITGSGPACDSSGPYASLLQATQHFDAIKVVGQTVPMDINANFSTNFVPAVAVDANGIPEGPAGDISIIPTPFYLGTPISVSVQVTAPPNACPIQFTGATLIAPDGTTAALNAPPSPESVLPGQTSLTFSFTPVIADIVTPDGKTVPYQILVRLDDGGLQFTPGVAVQVGGVCGLNAPVASLSLPPTLTPNVATTIDGTNSYDPDNAPLGFDLAHQQSFGCGLSQTLTYQWSITESISDGGAYLSGDPNAPTIDLTGTTPDDIITATLIVTDSSGLSSQPFSQTTTVGPYGP
jgi:VCBS repeat-containing protein